MANEFQNAKTFAGGRDRRRKQRKKFRAVMREFEKGNLRSSSGEKVTDPDQAQAIAFSEARRNPEKS